jgi:hypothetical protein
MKSLAGSTLILVVAALALMAGWTFRGVVPLPAALLAEPTYRFQSTAPKIEQVKQLGALVTLDVPVSDVVVSELTGYTGSVSAIVLVKGSVQVQVNLDTANFAAIDEAGKSAVLQLSNPTAVRPRLDHEQTRVFRTDRTGLWSLMPGAAGEGAVIERALAQAQNIVQQTADRPELIAQAREHAERVLQRFFSALGYTVRVQWQDTPPDTPDTPDTTPATGAL